MGSVIETDQALCPAPSSVRNEPRIAESNTHPQVAMSFNTKMVELDDLGYPCFRKPANRFLGEFAPNVRTDGSFKRSGRLPQE